MPRRYATRKRKRTKGRRKYRRRYRRALRRSYVPSGLTSTRVAKVRFVTNTTLTSSLGIMSTTWFYANNPSNTTGATLADTPMSWDYHATAFQQYCTLGSRVMVIPAQTGQNAGGSSINSYTGVYLSERSTTTYSDRAQYMEAQAANGRGTWRNLTGQRNQIRSMKAKYSAKKFWNLKDVKDNSQLWAPTNSGPSGDNSAYYILWSQVVDGSEQTTTQYQLIFDFIVLFREPRNID